MANEEELEQIAGALQTGTVDLLLIAHSDGRVTTQTKYSPTATGEWLIAMGQAMLAGPDVWDNATSEDSPDPVT